MLNEPQDAVKDLIEEIRELDEKQRRQLDFILSDDIRTLCAAEIKQNVLQYKHMEEYKRNLINRIFFITDVTETAMFDEDTSSVSKGAKL